MSHPIYEERQWFVFLWIILPIISLLTIGSQLVGLVPEKPALHLLIALTVRSNLLVLLFLGRLKISIDATHICWTFGFVGWPAWSLKLTEITSANPATSRWTEGWGIRYIKQDALYNVAGNQVLFIRKRDGSSVRLGSADPQRLLEFLQPRLKH